MLKKIVGIVLLLALGVGAYVLYSNPKVKNEVSQLINQNNSTQIKEKSIIEDKEDLIKLVQENMQTFALSLKKKEMTAFYNSLSDHWQQRISVEKLNKSFEPLMKAGFDLTVLKNMQPSIGRGTKITPEGYLTIPGNYSVKDALILFEQSYVLEGNEGWKLVGFSIDIKGKNL